MDLAARQFGEYTLVDQLGVGGTATVYLGRKRLHDGCEWVALKCLHPHLVEIDEIAELFLVEAEVLSRLHHPNVCEILRYGTEDGVPFIATRYLRGASLAELNRAIQGRPIPSALMGWIVAEACAGLHHAHEARNEEGAHLGLVHRDVSPQNIFVTLEGEVRLLDFGVARAAVHKRLSQTGEMKGKDGYMSPEQVEGGALDRRSDVFSMGIVLWESLTGRRLFERANHLATALAITESEAPDPRTIDPEIPELLARIALRALARQPEDRFPTALQMEHALRDAVADDLSPRIDLQILARSVLEDRPHPPEEANASDDLDESFLDATEIGQMGSYPAFDLEEGAGDSTAKALSRLYFQDVVETIPPLEPNPLPASDIDDTLRPKDGDDTLPPKDGNDTLRPKDGDDTLRPDEDHQPKDPAPSRRWGAVTVIAVLLLAAAAYALFIGSG